MKKLGKIGVVGRFKPLHNGGVVMLETLCENAEHVTIGLGSCNKYNARNPFTAEESKKMIDLVLSPKYSNYSTLFIPDYAHVPEYRDGKKWVEEVLEQYGPLDAFISGDDYVSDLLKEHYRIIHPASLIPDDKKIRVRATMARVEIAKGTDEWKHYVPKEVADYLENSGLVERFRKEFGLETLALLENGVDYTRHESSVEEKLHTMEA